jgi:predicted methyltransferase
MDNPRRRVLLAIAFCAGLPLGLGAAMAQSTAAPLSPDRIAELLASPDRTAVDRTNDLRRKPADMLAFIGIRPGIVAFDLSAAGGYTTELLARSVGPTGTVYGQSRPRLEGPAAPRPAAPEGNSRPDLASAAAVPGGPKPSPVALAEREARLVAAGVAAAPIITIVRIFEDPFPPDLTDARIDLVTLMFNYHDLGHMGVDRASMNRAVFRALKPGGVFAIADHAGRPGTGISESGTLHRIEESFLRSEVEAAGFRLAAEGDFLRNPNDPKDKNTPYPPQPKDEFVLKFVKP